MRKANINVIYEDNHIIAVNKPPGMLVHGDETGDITLLDLTKSYVKEKYKKPGDVFLGVIHRIDRPASGVTIFARTSKGLTRMNNLIKEREMEKNYLAIVQTRPPQLEAKLVDYIYKDEVKNKVHVYNKQKKGAKRAEMSYKTLAEISHYIKLEIDLVTGRSHQIRAQLAKLGCPIVGDRKYGYTKMNEDKSICLHCTRMSFIHPIKKEKITIKSRPPKKGIWSLFE